MVKNSLVPKRALRGESLLGPMSRALKLGVAAGRAAKKLSFGSKKVRSRNSKKKKSDSSGSSLAVGAMAYPSSLTRLARKMRTGLCREFITDLAASPTVGTFSSLLDLPLNPGNSRLFPREVALADMYEMYRFLTLKFVYEPTTAVVNSGVVGMYVDYDPVDSAAASMAAVMSNESATLGPIYTPMTLSVDCARNTWFYTQQQNTNTATANDRLQDLGDIRVFSDKCAANQSLGYLYVEYEIEFEHQKPAASIALSSSSMLLVNSGAVLQPFSGGVYQFVQLFPTNEAVNRGFGQAAALVATSSGGQINSDHTAINGATFAKNELYDPVVASSNNYYVTTQVTLFASSTVNASLFIYTLLPGDVSWTVVASTAFVGTGSSQTVVANTAAGGFALTPGSRVRVMILNTSTTVTNSISVISASLSMVAIAQANLGLRAPLSRASQPVPSASFSLPEQLDAAVEFLGSLNGSISIRALCGARSLPLVTHCDPEEKEYFHVSAQRSDYSSPRLQRDESDRITYDRRLPHYASSASAGPASPGSLSRRSFGASRLSRPN